MPEVDDRCRVSFGVACKKDLYSLNYDKHGMKCLRTGNPAQTHSIERGKPHVWGNKKWRKRNAKY